MTARRAASKRWRSALLAVALTPGVVAAVPVDILANATAVGDTGTETTTVAEETNEGGTADVEGEGSPTSDPIAGDEEIVEQTEPDAGEGAGEESVGDEPAESVDESVGDESADGSGEGGGGEPVGEEGSEESGEESVGDESAVESDEGGGEESVGEEGSEESGEESVGGESAVESGEGGGEKPVGEEGSEESGEESVGDESADGSDEGGGEESVGEEGSEESGEESVGGGSPEEGGGAEPVGDESADASDEDAVEGGGEEPVDAEPAVGEEAPVVDEAGDEAVADDEETTEPVGEPAATAGDESPAENPANRSAAHTGEDADTTADSAGTRPSTPSRTADDEDASGQVGAAEDRPATGNDAREEPAGTRIAAPRSASSTSGGDEDASGQVGTAEARPATGDDARGAADADAGPAGESAPAPRTSAASPRRSVASSEEAVAAPVEPAAGNDAGGAADARGEGAGASGSTARTAQPAPGGGAAPSRQAEIAPKQATGKSAGEPVKSRSVEQVAQVVATQKSAASTGRNLVVGNGRAATTDRSLTISSGTAAAIGNDEQTRVTQRAVTALSGAARAEIIQISIVFNIGGALASSGSNVASAGRSGGGSATRTGSAIAVGNDSQTYLTQAGTANAASGHRDSVNQRVLTLQLGVAASDSGNNTIVATVSDGSGGPATIASGNATSIGNRSNTSIEQIAQVVGRGHGELSVEQWATVLNLGVALANTGANQVGEMFAALLTDPDSDEIRELFEVLLPALLVGPGSPTGGQANAALDARTRSASPTGGEITSGNALAIGNRSDTHIQQLAVAVSSGDGQTGIRQEVVAVNAGAAAANSGGNSTGAGSTMPAPSLAPAVQSVVDRLSTYVAGLLRQIDAWVRGSEPDAGQTGLSMRVGEHLIDLGAYFSTSVGTGWSRGGVMATIRQLSAVFNLGVALADSGNNLAGGVTASTAPAAASTNSGPALEAGVTWGDPQDAVDADAGLSSRTVAGVEVSAPAAAPPSAAAATPTAPVQAALDVARETLTLATGDASARNVSVVVVCQRANVPSHECLGPPDDPGASGVGATGTHRAAPAAGSPSEAPIGGRSLPATGAAISPLTALGLLLLVLGAVLTSVARRRPV